MIFLVNKMDSMGANEIPSSNNSDTGDQFDNYLDDKTCVYETVIRGGYIKQEPCDTKDRSGSIHDYVNIKEEIIEDPTVVVEEPKLLTETKEHYCTFCEGCGEEYDIYCLKCPMLIRIFDSDNPNMKDNRVTCTLPKGFVDISETSSGVGVLALRTIPKGVVFGPFEGLHSTKDGVTSKWKLKNKELVYIKNPKWLNWMQYIRKADRSSLQNLTSFQYEDALYYRSDCHISAGDELLVCWDSDDGAENDMDDSYWTPQVCKRLDDTYACTLCCLGYSSILHLTAHNSMCPEKRNRKDFCEEIIKCAFCKIYMDKKEYSDYHMDRCCERNTKKYVTAPRPPEDSDKSELKNKHKCTMCEYSTSQKNNFKKHQLTHTDLRMYKCPECPYQARTKGHLEGHATRHANPSRSRFECEHCGEGFTRSDIFAMHQKKKHSASVYKCDKCVFQTTSGRDLERHLATHKDDKPYRCGTCNKQFKLEKTLRVHVKNLHNETKKKSKCPKCDFESIHPGCVKKHLLNIHSGVKRFQCPRCAFKTCHRENFDRHIRYHEDVKPYKCERCHMIFWTTQLLGRHEKEMHATADKIPNFACTICPYKTMKKSYLKRHLAVIHNDDKPFKCDVCPQMFKRKQDLTGHVRNIHSKAGKREYKCPQCPFETTFKASFKYHVNAHNKSELFQCSHCHYNTHHKGSFWKHQIRHERTKETKEGKILPETSYLTS